jgi:tRNA(His) guanylyltransferase
MKNHDPMGDRMKEFEKVETSRKCDPRKPICIRLDGKSFHTFTKGLERPYDERLSSIMRLVTNYLVKDTHAKVGYTQSDEISLIYNYEDESQPLFGGKFHKLTSVLAGMASGMFRDLLGTLLAEKIGSRPVFDCRVWQVPNKEEAANVILWRWFDARRNSISMLAQSEFSHKTLHGKDTKMMREMLLEKGIDWNTYPDFFKWGTFFQRKTSEIELSAEELANIPENHRPDGKVMRSRVSQLLMPPFVEVTNRVEVIFDGADPIIEASNVR